MAPPCLGELFVCTIRAPNSKTLSFWSTRVLEEVVEPMSRWLLPLRLCRLYLGNHLSASYVHYYRGQIVSIEPVSDFTDSRLSEAQAKLHRPG